MKAFRLKAKGQALVEFALILIVLLLIIFVIIEAGRLFQGWLTVQNSARAAGRLALTGQFETDCLFEFPPCLDPRVHTIKEEARRNSAGLSIDNSALPGETRSFVTEVWGQDANGVWDEDYAGSPGKAVRIAVFYEMPVITPLLRPIANSVRLVGQVLVNNENFDQVTSSASAGNSPNVGSIGGPPPPQPFADLSVTKSVTGTNVLPGTPPLIYSTDDVFYTIDVVNLGDFDAEDVVVVDTLPTDSVVISSTVVSPTPGGFCNLTGSTELTCYLPDLSGDLSPLGQAQVIIHAETPAEPAPGIITNTVSVAAGPSTIDPDPTNNSDFQQLSLIPWSQVFVEKSDSFDPVKAEQPYSYSIQVTNDGPNPATNVQLIDTLPIEASFVSVDPPSCSWDGNLEISCNLSDLPPDGTPTFVDIDVLAPNTTSVITITNGVVVTADQVDRGLGDRDDTEDTQIEPLVADLEVNKFGFPEPVPVDEQLTYSIQVDNNGPDPARGVTLVDTLPASVDFESASHPGCSESGGIVTCALGDLNPGASANVTIRVTPRSIGSITNEASVTGGGLEVDDDLTNNFDDEVTLVIPRADLETQKSGPAIAYILDIFTYDLTVTNHGPYPATEVVLTDILSGSPGDVSFDSGSPGCSGNDATAICDMGNIAVGASKSITISVLAEDTGNFLNRASAVSNEADVNSTNDLGTATTAIDPKADLEIRKTAQDPIYAGGIFTYTIEVFNHGPTGTGGVTVVDVLPANITGTVIASPSQGSCTVGAGSVSCPLGFLDDGNTATIDLFVIPAMDGTITNEASVTADEYDPGIYPNTVTVTHTVLAAANLSIVKSAPVEIDVTEKLSYDLLITNNGPSDASAIVVTDTLPSSIVSPTITADLGWTCAVSGSEIVCDRLLLAGGASSSINIVGQPTSTGFIDNTAEVRSAVADFDLSDNVDTVVTLIDADLDLEIIKTAPEPAFTGESFTYVLTGTNTSTYWAHDVRITDTLPLTVTHVSTSPGSPVCYLNGNVITCDVGDLPPLGAYSVDITVIPNERGIIANTVEIDGLESDTNVGNDSFTLLTTVDPAADLEVSKSGPAIATVFEKVIYSIDVTNNGVYTATNVTVTDTLPLDTTFDSASTNCGPIDSTTVACQWLVLPIGATVGVTIAVTPEDHGTFTNTVTVGANEFDPIPGNNNDVAVTEITQSDLAVVKSASSPVFAGLPLTYTIDITNSGPSPATGVVVTDSLPGGAGFIGASPECSNLGGGVVRCDVGDVVSTSRLLIVVSPAAEGIIVNTVEVLGNEYDPNLVDNTFTLNTDVDPATDLAITKTGPATVTRYESFNYTLDVDNNGPSGATGVVVTDTLPANLQFDSASAGCSEASPGTIVCNVGTISSSASTSFNISVTANQPGIMVNSAKVTGTEYDPDLSNNTDFWSTDVTQVDLELTKAGPASVTVFEDFDYFLNVFNNGPSDATGIVLTDTLPISVTFVSASSGCTYDGNVTVVCTVGNLAAGAPPAVRNIRVTPIDHGTIFNTATVIGNEYDPNLANNTDTATTNVTQADLEVDKFAPDPSYLDQKFTYTVVITNHGPSMASGVTMVDNLPDEVTYDSNDSGCRYRFRQHRVICDIGSIAAGASMTIHINVVPDQIGSIQNYVNVVGDDYDPDTSNNSTVLITTVEPASDLAISKSAPATVTVFETFAYTLSVTNNGPSDATAVVVTDTLPADVLFFSGSAGCSDLGGGLVRCDVGVISVSGTSVVNINVTPLPASQGTIVNSALAEAAEFDPDNTDNSDSASTDVYAVDLEIDKFASSPTYAGTVLTYTLVITNNGPVLATAVMVTDTLPAGVTFDSADAGCALNAGNVVACDLGNLPASGSTSAQIRVTPSTQGDYENNATVSAVEYDPVLANNDTSITTTVDPGSDLAITKSAPISATVGSTFNYDISVDNNGPSDVSGVIITDTLPGRVTYISASAGCAPISSSTIVCNLGNILNGGTANASIMVQADSVGTAVNSAIVDGVEFDADTSDNSDSASTLITEADLEITKSASNPAYLQETLTYQLRVDNNGPSAVASVTVTDTLPASVSLISATAGCSLAFGTTVTCNLAGIAVSASKTVTIAVTPNQVGDIANRATVDGSENDPVSSNNTDTITTTVQPSTDLSVDKVAPASANVGQDFEYLLTATNNGPSNATGVTVIDSLPAGVTYNSSSGACSFDGSSTVICTAGNFAVSASAVFTISVTAGSQGAAVNTAVVGGDQYDPDNSNNSDSETTNLTEADLAINKSAPASVTVGEIFAYGLEVTNNGPDTATGVVVTDSLPSAVSWVFGSPGCSFNNLTSTATCLLSDLADGASHTVTVTVQANQQGDIENTTYVSGDKNDPVAGNNSDAVTTNVTESDLEISKATSGPAYLDEPLVYTLVITNHGPSLATGIVLTDTLPATVSVDSADAGCVPVGGFDVSCTISSLAASATVTRQITVIPGLQAPIYNSVVVDSNQHDPDNSNNFDGITSAVNPSADMSISKTAEVSATVGSTFVYTIAVTNNGPSLATNVTITDALPSQVSFVSATLGCSESGGVVTCNIGALSATATGTVIITVQADQSGTAQNTSFVSANELDPQDGNNDSEATTIVVIN